MSAEVVAGVRWIEECIHDGMSQLEELANISNLLVERLGVQLQELENNET